VNKKPSLFKIEQYLTGELSPVEIQEFEALMGVDPGLKEYVQAQRSIRYEGPVPVFQAKIQRTSAKESVFSILGGKIGEWVSPLLHPQVAWAMGLCLLAGSVMVLFRPDRLQSPSVEFTAKGSDIPFQLRVNGRQIQPEQTGFARAGETMSFAYRSLAGMNVQVWYQDDGGEIKPYVAQTAGASWSRSSAWREADYKIILSSDWNRESVWILWSERNFTPQESRKVLEGVRSDAIQKVGYHLVRTP
jgi:hypothetical protein